MDRPHSYLWFTSADRASAERLDRRYNLCVCRQRKCLSGREGGKAGRREGGNVINAVRVVGAHIPDNYAAATPLSGSLASDKVDGDGVHVRSKGVGDATISAQK